MWQTILVHLLGVGKRTLLRPKEEGLDIREARPSAGLLRIGVIVLAEFESCSGSLRETRYLNNRCLSCRTGPFWGFTDSQQTHAGNIGIGRSAPPC